MRMVDTIKNSSGRTREDRVVPHHHPELLSAWQIYNQGTIYWVSSYKTTIKYIKRYDYILKPITSGRGTGKRYHVSKRNLFEFIKRFEKSEL